MRTSRGAYSGEPFAVGKTGPSKGMENPPLQGGLQSSEPVPEALCHSGSRHEVSFPPKLASSCCLPLPEDISSCPVLSPCGSRSLLGDQNPACPSGVLLMMLLHGASRVSANGATFIHLFHESLNSQLSIRGSVSHLSLSVGSTLLTPPQHPR